MLSYSRAAVFTWRLLGRSAEREFLKELMMSEHYRRLAVFVDNPGIENFVWIVLESTGDPAVWLDLETGFESYDTWIEAFEAGNLALRAYVDDEDRGPIGESLGESEESDGDDGV
ncbi:hypothetical protein QTI24_29505 [Variovorax sp. J22P240]|uniref:hypothetical protein n=1 Tax=Variovorax sp. J22P240 TaxID=3053514 RepID=UPI0025752FAF|nr:hypothetical protein [Variovorax sp. J22P240]MDM0002764.1 hypothetical protein [Variovorax sp. J22P240]